MPPETPTFFVDFVLAADDAGSPRVGFAFRVDSQVLGDEDIDVNVRSVIDALTPILRHETDRRDVALMALPLEPLFRRLEVGVFVYADPGIDAGSDWKRFVRFVALPRECATFRGWSAYLVEDDEQARLVWRDPSGKLGEARLVLGELESALRAFRAELEASLEKAYSVMPRSGERLKSDPGIDVPASVRARAR